MNTTRSAMAYVEIAHQGVDGVMHGHSLSVRAWTRAEVDLDRWQDDIAFVGAMISGPLEKSAVQGRTFEDVAAFFLDKLPNAFAVQVVLVSRGHEVYMTNERA